MKNQNINRQTLIVESAPFRAKWLGQLGAATMPVVIGVALVVTLVQVPLWYQTNAGSKFSGEQKKDVYAKNLAEAGIDQVISDIGLQRIRPTLDTDTIPYEDVAMGNGSFTTRVMGYNVNPDRVEVRSTGTVGSINKIVKARMELVKTLTTIPYDTPIKSAWGINGTPPTLYYYALSKRDSGLAWVYPEGEVDLGAVASINIDDFTVAPNGIMYFINQSGNSSLYRIRPTGFDNDPSTPVPVELIGETGIMAGSDDEIRGLILIASDSATEKTGVLYGLSWKSKKVWELNIDDGTAFHLATLNQGGTFVVDAVTEGHNGTLYLVRTTNNSELWKFTDFPTQGTYPLTHPVVKVADITNGNNKIRAMAGHPDGYLYGTDDTKWYKVNPANGAHSNDYVYTSNLKGVGFHYERERLKFDGTPIPGHTYICHQLTAANAQTLFPATPGVLNGHLAHGDLLGYCGLGAGGSISPDTTIQLKIISWEEFDSTVVAGP